MRFKYQNFLDHSTYELEFSTLNIKKITNLNLDGTQSSMISLCFDLNLVFIFMNQ